MIILQLSSFEKDDKYLKGAKHIKLEYLSVKKEVRKHRVSLEHIRNDIMIVDPQNKGLPPMALNDHLRVYEYNR